MWCACAAKDLPLAHRLWFHHHQQLRYCEPIFLLPWIAMANCTLFLLSVTDPSWQLEKKVYKLSGLHGAWATACIPATSRAFLVVICTRSMQCTDRAATQQQYDSSDDTDMPLCTFSPTNEPQLAPAPGLIHLSETNSKAFCSLATDIVVCLRSMRSPSMTL